MQNFVVEEFVCKCCGKGDYIMQPRFLDMIDRARTIAGIPFVITSGYRCEVNNFKCGGRIHSSHRTGWAADISAPISEVRMTVVNGLINAGFKRIGIARSFVHADCDPNKPDGVLWIY